MPVMKRVGHELSAFIVRSIFALMYVGGLFLFLMGLILTSQAWWGLVHHRAGFWAISVTTLEIVVLAAAFGSILIISHLQNKGSNQRPSWREKREAGRRGTSQPQVKNASYSLESQEN